MMAQSTKNPEKEAENPAPMPKAQQGQGGPARPLDPEGRQGGYHPKMEDASRSPPELEPGKPRVSPVDEGSEADGQKAPGKKR